MTKLQINLLSGMSADGFAVKIIKDDKSIFTEDYRYGYNASWCDAMARDNKPYVTTIIKNLLTKFNLTISDVDVINGENAFTGTAIDKAKVTEFINDYLSVL